MKYKPFASVLLSAILLVSCDSQSTIDNISNETSSDSTSTETEPAPLVPIRDLGGKTFTFYIRYEADGWGTGTSATSLPTHRTVNPSMTPSTSATHASKTCTTAKSNKSRVAMNVGDRQHQEFLKSSPATALTGPTDSPRARYGRARARRTSYRPEHTARHRSLQKTTGTPSSVKSCRSAANHGTLWAICQPLTTVPSGVCSSTRICSRNTNSKIPMSSSTTEHGQSTNSSAWYPADSST